MELVVTPAARKILEEMTAGADLIRDGIRAYCGNRAVSSRAVTALVWASAIKEIAPSCSPGVRYYEITEMGRRYLRRPELEQEYYEWVRLRKGPFTVKNDQIVALD